MNFNQKILEANQKLFELVSTKDITLLKDLDSKIKVIKEGKFKYYKSFNFEIEDIRNFLKNLDSDKIYTLIPFISINNKIDEPHTILSQQILITSKSNALLLSNYINNKINDTENLFNIQNLPQFWLIFKYKSIEIDFESYKKFV